MHFLIYGADPANAAIAAIILVATAPGTSLTPSVIALVAGVAIAIAAAGAHYVLGKRPQARK